MSVLLSGYVTLNECVNRSHEALQDALSIATNAFIRLVRPNLRKYVLRLTYAKYKLWKSAKCSGDISQFKAARRLLRTSLYFF